MIRAKDISEKRGSGKHHMHYYYLFYLFFWSKNQLEKHTSEIKA